MSTRDIQFAVSISSREGWGTPRSDFTRILRVSPGGSFVAYEGNSRVGMITTVNFGKKVAWMGNVIVDKNHRGKRVGRNLVAYAVDYLKSIRVKHIGLYCFRENVDFYEKLGFVKDTQFLRLRRPRKPVESSRHGPSELPITLSRLVSLDRRAFGADRSELLRLLITEGYGTCFTGSSRKEAFLVVKKYGTGCDLGPGVAFHTSREELNGLLEVSIEYAGGKPIEVSCLAQNHDYLQLLREHGFHVINRGYRMFWNEKVRLGSTRASFLLGFQDKG